MTSINFVVRLTGIKTGIESGNAGTIFETSLTGRKSAANRCAIIKRDHQTRDLDLVADISCAHRNRTSGNVVCHNDGDRTPILRIEDLYSKLASASIDENNLVIVGAVNNRLTLCAVQNVRLHKLFVLDNPSGSCMLETIKNLLSEARIR